MVAKYTTATFEQDVISDVICNACGKSCIVESFGDEKLIECVTIDKLWGWGSRKDGAVEKAHICEDCWDKFARTFVIETELE